tara:strand:- start:1411 stop:2847 length:1437 start_codon:yes stop_codon:yes gene_type:complete
MPVTQLGNVALPDEYQNARTFAEQAYGGQATRRSTVGGYLYQPFVSTNEHAVWYNASTKDVHVSYRGTEKTSVKDLTSDAMLMFRGEGANERFKDSVRDTLAIVAKFPGASLSLSGHSLGGQLATYVLHNLPDDTAQRVTSVTTFNKAATPLPSWFQFNPDRVSKQTNIKQAGDPVSEMSEPDDSRTLVFNNYTGGGLAAHRLDSFEVSDQTATSVTRKSIVGNLTKEALKVAAGGAADPYSAVANVAADAAVTAGIPGAGAVKTGMGLASAYGVGSAVYEGAMTGAVAEAALPLAAAGAVMGGVAAVEALDEALFTEPRANPPAMVTLSDVSRAYLPVATPVEPTDDAVTATPVYETASDYQYGEGYAYPDDTVDMMFGGSDSDLDDFLSASGSESDDSDDYLSASGSDSDDDDDDDDDAPEVAGPDFAHGLVQGYEHGFPGAEPRGSEQPPRVLGYILYPPEQAAMYEGHFVGWRG